MKMRGKNETKAEFLVRTGQKAAPKAEKKTEKKKEH